MFMHLTNYAINKNSENFVQNDGEEDAFNNYQDNQTDKQDTS